MNNQESNVIQTCKTLQKCGIRWGLIDDHMSIDADWEVHDTGVYWFAIRHQLEIEEWLRVEALNLEVNGPEAPWNNPDVSLIRLLSGKAVVTQVNGLDLETRTGFVLVDSEERPIELVDGEWQETPPGRNNKG